VRAGRGQLAAIARHYDGKVRAFGATPLGVDWPSLRAMHARLLQLLEVVDGASPAFSINDLGCGWGAALDVIEHWRPDAGIDYAGVDVAPAMIDAARARWGHRPRTSFTVGAQCTRTADYSIASGIFNVKLAHPRDGWERHIGEVLLDLYAHSRSGFAVNFMLPGPSTRRVPQLYTTEPEPWVIFCAAMGAREVDVERVPALDEFTLRVR
jgi:hypothetical protein